MSISDKFLNGFVTLRRLVYRLWKLCSILFIAKNCIWWAVFPIGPLFMKYIMVFFVYLFGVYNFSLIWKHRPYQWRASLQLLWNCSKEFHVTLLLNCTYCLHARFHRKFLFDFFSERTENFDGNNLCETSLACVLYVNLNDREAVWICVWKWASKCYMLSKY